MKVSVLLPTRDRLELLRHAVQSVRMQEGDWELVISDNDSREDVAGYVAALEDPRIRYLRTERLVPVTENWNNALRHAGGDYVVMLGDDDALLAGYFETMQRLVERFEAPELIYHGALLYAYPGVLPGEADGYLQPYGYAPFLREATEPARLDRATARAVVAGAMDFRVSYGFNMQFALIARAAIERLAGGGDFFRSPFPDYYAMNLLMLRAESIVAEPRPCVAIGVSPRSYGFYHVNRREAEGRAMLEGLGDDRAQDNAERLLLPGTNINTGWLLAMLALRQALGDAEPDLRPNLRRYRMLQTVHVYDGHYLQGTVGREEIAELWARMSRRERLLYGSGARLARALRRLVPARLRPAVRVRATHALGQLPRWSPGRDPRHYTDVLDVIARVQPDVYPRRWPQPGVLARLLRRP